MIFDKAFHRSARQKSALVQKTATALTLESTEGWPPEENASDGALKVSTVFRCVDVRSSIMAVLPVYLLNEGSKERVQEHYLGEVLWGQANEAMSNFDFQKLMAINQDLKGNAYAWLYRCNGRVVERYPLPPESVTPFLDAQMHLWYRFVQPKTGQVFYIPPEDMIHYKGFSTNGLWGISVLQWAAQTVQTERSAGEYEAGFYANSGRPSGVLTAKTDLNGTTEVPQADGTSVKKRMKDVIRDDWERMYRGSGNAFRTAVLDMDLTYQPIAMSSADAQFVESKEVRVADLCRYFGTPLHLVFAGKQSYDSNEQNSLEFMQYTMLPQISQWNQEDTNKLLLPGDREKGLRIKREMKAYLQGDTTAQAAWYKALREVGVYSVDDIRALEDLPNVPGGKSRYASWNYGPLERFEELSVLRAAGGQQQKE